MRTDPAAGISNQLKAITQRLEHKDPRKREVTSFNVSVLGIGAGVSAAHRAEPGEPTYELARINSWSDRLAQLAGGKKILLMLDEVQELAIHPDGGAVAAALRASFQRNYGVFEPVFTGSQRDRLLQMFDAPQRSCVESEHERNTGCLADTTLPFVARVPYGRSVTFDQSHGGYCTGVLPRVPTSFGYFLPLSGICGAVRVRLMLNIQSSPKSNQ